MKEKDVQNKLVDIYKIISKKHNSEIETGLISGKWGEILFLTQYTKHFNTESNIAFFEERLKAMLNRELQFNDISFANGLAGIGWSICYLLKKDVLDANDFEDLLTEIDNLIEKHLDVYDHEKKFDFLYGLVGIGTYVLERKNERLVKLIILKLKKWSINGTSECAWTCEMNIGGNQTKVYDMCLAHGIASILFFLSKCIANNISKDEATTLLKEAYSFYSQQKKSISNDLLYPDYIEIEKKSAVRSNRLAWCYGDLSRSLVIYNVGVALENDIIKKEGNELCLKLTDELLTTQPLVFDAGICHGRSGIAQMFNRMYYNTSNIKFKNAAEYWIRETIKFSKFNDGLAGYKKSDGENIWINDYSLLEGISGIGLVLLGFLTDDVEDLDWDRCLFLS